MRFTLPRWDRHGYLFAVACVAAATLLFLLGRNYFAKGQWALLYLLLIVFIAGIGGFRASLLAAVASFLAWNYFFLPPYGTLIIADVKDWLSLFVFLLVGIAMGLQTARMRERETDARAREQEAALLSRLSAGLVSISSLRTLTEMIRNEVTRFTGAQPVVLFLPGADGLIPQPDEPLPDAVTQPAAWVYRQNKAIGLPFVTSLAKLGVEGWPISVAHGVVMDGPPRQDLYLPLQSTARLEGVLYVGARADATPYTPHDARLLVSIANLAAGFLERQHLEALAGQAEAQQESERLKRTLISSVSHELKTPLAAIKATMTSLLGEDVAWDRDMVRAEVRTACEDLTRLDASIEELLNLSRLKADDWTPQRDWYEFGEVVGAMLAKLPAAERRRIAFAIPEELPAFCIDFQQWLQVVLHLTENALAYAPPGSQVVIGASALPHELRFWVEDQGPGIPPGERERIFEQFYRGSTAAKAPTGTGLGLAIAAEIVRFHDGRIWVEDVQPHGARFVVALPQVSACERDGK